MSGGGPTNTVTQNSSPPPQFMNALSQIGTNAQNVAQTPYQAYPGQLVAGFSPDQLQGIQTIQGSQGITAPYINAAAQAIGASTTPLQPSIQPYADQATGLYNQAASTPLAATAAPGISQANGLYGQSAALASSMPGSVAPGIAAADNYYNASTRQLTPTQFSAGQVAQYESPYTQQVVNATQAEFNNQNQQQMQGVRGNAISQGAFGGDREAVAEGITAGQQQLAQAPVIANLKNQGYSQALQEFNQQQQVGLGAQQATQQLMQGAGAGILAGGNQVLAAQQGAAGLQQSAGAGILAGNAQGLSAQQAQAQLALAAGQGITGVGGQILGANEANAWLNSQAGFGLGNLGNEALNSNLTAANAQLGIGGMEQGLAQQQLNVPYEQFIQQQAYPFQTAAWAAGLGGELANAAGGTASTTSPGPSPISQLAGLGVTGLALNSMGAFNGLGSVFGAGAGSAAGATAAGLAASAPYLSSFGAAGGGGAILDTLGGALLAKDGGRIPQRSGGGIVAFPSHRARPGAGITGANDNHFPQMALPRRLAAGGAAVPQMQTPGGIVTIKGGNGIDIPQLPTTAGQGAGITGGSGISGLNDYLANTAAGAYHAPIAPPAPAPVPAAGPGPATPAPAGPSTITPDQVNFLQNMMDDQARINNVVPGPMARGGIVQRRDDGGPLGDDSDLPVPPMPPGQGISGPPAPPASGIMGGAPAGMGAAPEQPASQQTAPSRLPWGEALLSAGLSMMGGTSPHALTNIGRGGMQGLQFGEQQRAIQERENLSRLTQQETAKYHSGELNLRGQQLQQTGELTKAEMAQKAAFEQAQMAQQLQIAKMHVGMEGANLAETQRYHQAQLDQGRYTWGAGMGPDPTDPTKQVAGMYRLPTKGDEPPQFIAGQTLTTKQNGAPEMPADVTQMLAERVLAGDTSALAGLGYGSTGTKARIAVQTAVTNSLHAQGLTGSDLAAKTAEFMGEKAGARTAGTREANVGMAVTEAQKFMPLALAASERVPRSSFPTLNAIQQAVEQGTGNEDVVRLNVATNSLVNAYSRAITPSGIPTEGNQQRARELLDKAWSQGQYRAAVDQLMQEMNAAKASPVQQQQEQRERISGHPAPAAATLPPAQTEGGGAASAPAIPRISSPADAAKLPSGTKFLDPNGVMRMVP